MPVYDVASRHSIAIRSDPQRAYDAILACNLETSWIARSLFALRGLSRGASQRTRPLPIVDRVARLGFVRLSEDPPREIVIGLIGRFWKASGDLQRFAAREFPLFEEPGFAKAAWNFLVTRCDDGSVFVSTETRVRCLDDASRRKFALYWTVVGPFSGLIRMEMLREIRRRATEPLM